MSSPLLTRATLYQDLARIGIAPGDTVMVHAAVSAVGPILGGPDMLISALRDAVGPEGTLMAYADWDAGYEALLGPDGTLPPAWREHVSPFDPSTSRATRDNGILPEFLRTTPGALRSASPGPSMVALGAKAQWLTADHPIDYGYGEGSPLARLVEANGKVLMLGAPLDTMTLLHHAEHLADLPGKRIKRVEVPFATKGGTEWRMVEEFDTSDAVTPALDGIEYFTAILTTLLDTGVGRQGLVGKAESALFPAAEVVGFAVAWLEAQGR